MDCLKNIILILKINGRTTCNASEMKDNTHLQWMRDLVQDVQVQRVWKLKEEQKAGGEEMIAVLATALTALAGQPDHDTGHTTN